MPMCDVYLPSGVLSTDAERQLLSRVTDLLLEHEGADPENEAAQSIARLFVHRPEIFVGGAAASDPYYKFVCQVPESQYDDERRSAVTESITRAVADAEGTSFEAVAPRVWVFSLEIPEGTWGGSGRIAGLADIYEFVSQPREDAEERLAGFRADRARAAVEAAAAAA